MKLSRKIKMEITHLLKWVFKDGYRDYYKARYKEISDQRRYMKCKISEKEMKND